MNKKIFAITLLSAAVLAGCSSDDDDDGGMEQEPMTPPETMNPPGEMNPPGQMNPPQPSPEAATLPAADAYDPTTALAADGSVVSLNLAETATGAGLTELVSAAGNCPTISDLLVDADARLTVFAPTDAAFGAAEVGAAINAGADVCDVLAGHVIVDSVAASTDLAANIGNTVMTAAGTTLLIGAGTDPGTLTIGGATVAGADNFATNGVAHVIDAVLLPAGEEPGTPGMTPTPPGPGGGAGAEGSVQAALSASPNTEFVALFNMTFGGETFDERATPGEAWTIFGPTNESIPDDFDGEVLPLLRDHIISSGKLTLEQISSMSEIVTNLGTTYAIGGTSDAPTIGGAAIGAVLGEDDNTIVYSLDGLLVAQ